MANLNPKSCKVIHRMSAVTAGEGLQNHFSLASFELIMLFPFNVGKTIGSFCSVGAGGGD